MGKTCRRKHAEASKLEEEGEMGSPTCRDAASCPSGEDDGASSSPYFLTLQAGFSALAEHPSAATAMILLFSLGLCVVSFMGALAGGIVASKFMNRSGGGTNSETRAGTVVNQASAALGHGDECNEEDGHPSALVCVITSELFCDPVFAMDGHSCACCLCCFVCTAIRVI